MTEHVHVPLVGTWHLLSFTVGGQPRDFSDGYLTYTEDGYVFAILVTAAAGPGEPRPVKIAYTGRYTLTGQTLRVRFLCAFPGDFEGSEMVSEVSFIDDRLEVRPQDSTTLIVWSRTQSNGNASAGT